MVRIVEERLLRIFSNLQSAQLRHVLPIAAIAAFSACAQPDYARIQGEFQKANPRCTVDFVGPGEGDGDHVYVHIKYKCPGDDRPRKTAWLYRRQGSKWRKVSSAPDDRMSELPARPRQVGTSSNPVEESPVSEQPFRVGGDVLPPVLINKVEPEYPRGTRSVAGAIVLEGVVTKTGAVQDLRVIKGADDPMTASVVAAVRQWKFRPATRRGEPVDVIYNVTTHIHVK